MVALFGALALAAPEFVADDPGDTAVARLAWDAAVECTGWEPPHRPTVPIERGYVPGGYLGRALHDGGLSLIELSVDSERADEVIVHEVAHAWVSDGPTALAEGRAELLADCMTRRRPGLAPLQWDDGRDVLAMPRLQSWTTGHEHEPLVLGDARTDAYIGAARFVRTAAEVVDPRLLWSPEGLDWSGLETLLSAAGERGEALLALLEADVQTQRHQLSDHDRDGRPAVSERLNQTDPTRWDSDGDGWWDGARPPAGAVPVALDGSPICLGVGAGDTPARARIVTGGDLRGVPLPGVRPLGDVADDGSILLGPGQPLVARWALPTNDVSGGLWVSAAGELEASSACQTTALATVWSLDGRHSSLVAVLTDAIDEAAETAAHVWGPATGRIALALGGKTSTVRDGVVHLSERDLDDPQAAARLAVAVHRAWTMGEPDWRAATGMAHMLAAR